MQILVLMWNSRTQKNTGNKRLTAIQLSWHPDRYEGEKLDSFITSFPELDCLAVASQPLQGVPCYYCSFSLKSLHQLGVQELLFSLILLKNLGLRKK